MVGVTIEAEREPYINVGQQHPRHPKSRRFVRRLNAPRPAGHNGPVAVQSAAWPPRAESIAALFQIVQELSIFFSRVLINYSEGERVVGELILESLVATLCAQDFVNSLQEPTPPFVSIGVPQLTGPLNTLMKQQNFTFGIFVIRDLNTSANIAHLWEYCNTHDLEFTLFDAGVIMQSDLFSNPFASAKNLFFELLDLTCVRIANRANCENQYRKNQDWMIDRTAQQPTTKADFGLDHVSQLN